jgi:hypothetical protein
MPTREKLADISWEPVEDSSNVHSLFHHPATETICVRFNGGGLYSYMGHLPTMSSEEIYMSLCHAESVGSYLHNVVKALPYTRWSSEAELLNHLNT